MTLLVATSYQASLVGAMTRQTWAARLTLFCVFAHQLISTSFVDTLKRLPLPRRDVKGGVEPSNNGLGMWAPVVWCENVIHTTCSLRLREVPHEATRARREGLRYRGPPLATSGLSVLRSPYLPHG